MKGLIFSIEEFAVHDGDGLRSTVFFKGCPLRCQWCHNPEGWFNLPQRVKNPNGCLHCGRCDAACPRPGRCTACGHCAAFCPRGLIRISGQYWEAPALAERIKRNFPDPARGGVTLSGGEPLMQPEFLMELLDELRPLSRAIETSAYGAPEIFAEALRRLEFVFMDVKHMDEDAHKRHTGVSNRPILRNLDLLMDSGVSFTIRVPVIMGVNDGEENTRALGERLWGCTTLRCVELLPYHRMAGAKYGMLGWQYTHGFAPPPAQTLERLVEILGEYGLCATHQQQI